MNSTGESTVGFCLAHSRSLLNATLFAQLLCRGRSLSATWNGSQRVSEALAPLPVDTALTFILPLNGLSALIVRPLDGTVVIELLGSQSDFLRGRGDTPVGVTVCRGFFVSWAGITEMR